MLTGIQVARDIFVDNVLNQVVERHLMAELHQIFWNYLGLNEKRFYEIWRDDDYATRAREKERFEQKRDNLEKCLRKLDSVSG